MTFLTERLEELQARLHYRFRDNNLLRGALTHTSAASARGESNERLEFLGDAVMGLIVCGWLYDHLPHAQEGEMTKIKSAVVSRKICARIAERLGLGEFLLLGQGMDSGEQMPRSLAAGALEAVIAAIYLDGGLDAARTFVLANMQPELKETIDSDHQYNYKSQLQQWAQRVLGATPHYDVLDEKGPDHAKCFEIAVRIRDRQFPGAWAPSKKEAEQHAARLALVQVGELEPEPRPEDDGLH